MKEERILFKHYRLLDICDVYQPHTITTQDFVVDGKYTVYGANGPIGKYDRYNHEDSEVVMACRGASCGALNITGPKSWINGNAMVIHPKGTIALQMAYLFYTLLSAEKSKLITGTAQPQITRNSMKNFIIPICEEGNQACIVSRIEELFSQLDANVAELKTAKERLKMYRQAVLKEAFDRIKGNSDILSIKQVCHDIKVGIVIKPAQYYTGPDEGIPAFRSANIREFHIQNRDWVYLTKTGHQKNIRSEVHTNDVLIVRSGYPGTACVISEQYNGYNAIDILIAVPNMSIVLPEYLCAYTNSPYGKQLVREKKRGVAQAHLNVGGYSKMNIPVPPITVQREIISTIESRLSICDSIEKTVDTALQQAEALRQSILKKAFEGGL